MLLGWVQMFQHAMGCVGSGDDSVFTIMRCVKSEGIQSLWHCLLRSCKQLWQRDILSVPCVTQDRPYVDRVHASNWVNIGQLSIWIVHSICCRVFSFVHKPSPVARYNKRQTIHRLVYLYHFSIYIGFVSGVKW